MTERDFLEEMGFGELNPLNRELEEMFGSAFLDSPDFSGKDIFEELERLVEGKNWIPVNLSYLIGEVIKRVPELDCEEAQQKMMTALEEIITEDPNPTINNLDIWTCIVHRSQCCEPICVELVHILQQDKRLTPKEMRARYEEFKTRWFPKD